MHLSEINIYPVKSLKGIPLDEAVVQERGLQNDRRWMLVDENNKFMTQREFPAMALITVKVDDSHLTASIDDKAVEIPFASEADDLARVTIWNSTVRANIYGPEINSWFSQALQTNCRLVVMPDDSKRMVNPDYAVRKFEDTVSFADGYPFLLIGEGSLADLNSRLETPIPMNRFRPNLVVSGSEPFAEDTWKRIRVGETIFHIVKPCERCVITTIDQTRGDKTGKEPLRTMATYRKQGDGVLFGQNLIAEKAGAVIKRGDVVEVLETKA